MTAKHLCVCVALFSTVALIMPANAQHPDLGSITFPTSAAPAAQPAFVEGVKDLHSFEFDEAAEAFKKAQQADPAFALAYWGEAMSYNHPLWAQVDVAAAKKALEKLAPTSDERVAKARLPKEKGLIEAVNQLFYAPGDKLARDRAYSQVMARMYGQSPDDPEISILYALSLLGTVRPGDKGFRRQALAASIAQRVFNDNPNHPGAAHFIIHAFDDPDHAILALPAARVYAGIAPSAPHALHMPSHIFVQLGMWQDVEKSNIVAYRAATELNQRMHLAEGREDFHTLSWLTYAQLMMGKFDEAKKNVELAKTAADRNPGNPAVQTGYLGMRARYMLETGRWERVPVEDAVPNGSAHASMPGMQASGSQYGGGGTWAFIAGVSAVKLGDSTAAGKAEARLRTMREETEASGDAYGAKPFAIMEKELGALIKIAGGQKAEAVRLAKEAADIDLTMSAPSGPPEPIKPALELYADVLLEAGQSAEAAVAYESALLRTPNRQPSVKGLERARNTGTATRQQD
jgi:tetratricopeptide (TPR) repeat protein